MTADPRTHLEALPAEVGLWLNAACNRFEAAWRDGRRPRLADYLDDTPEPRRWLLVDELIGLDIEYRRKLGEVPRPEDYQTPFPSAPLDWLAQELAGLKQAGRYQLKQEVARGGMGVVYRAFDPELDREVAVKVLHEGFTHSPEARRRFLDEAQIAARLQHPGLERKEKERKGTFQSCSAQGLLCAERAAELPVS